MKDSDWVVENRGVIKEAMLEAKKELELDKCVMGKSMEWDSSKGMVRWIMRCDEGGEYWRWVVV